MWCKTEQRQDSRSFDPRVSSHYDPAKAGSGGSSRTAGWAEINDHHGPAPAGPDRIRLIAIEMKGAFGNEGALPLLFRCYLGLMP